MQPVPTAPSGDSAAGPPTPRDPGDRRRSLNSNPCPQHCLSGGLELPHPRGGGHPPLPSPGLSASLTLVAGPYIVYMLQEIDILEDWTAIKKVGPCCLLCTPSQERDWRVGPHLRHRSGLCRLSAPGSPEGLAPRVPWHCHPLTSLLLSKAALQEGTSSLCWPFLFQDRF